MHFSKIYLQDNFVPNIVEDQFRRKVIGVEVSLNEGESLEEAKQEAEKYIKDYIYQNTVTPDHNHIEVRTIPDIKVEKSTAQSLEEQIMASKDIAELDTWKVISNSNHKLGMAFAKRAAFLLSPDNKSLKKQNHDTKSKRNPKGN